MKLPAVVHQVTANNYARKLIKYVTAEAQGWKMSYWLILIAQ